jgi:hypothetical protein
MFYCGLDVSLRETAICIVDADGKIVKEQSSATHKLSRPITPSKGPKRKSASAKIVRECSPLA